MRDIKFRAWDRFAKEMVFAKTIDFGINGAECIVDSSGIIGEVESEWDLEQFTGLHDKKGKEIYEGDIVKVYGFSKVTVGNVIYEDYYFTFDGFCDTGTDRPEMAFSEGEFEVNYEVIGNIHENPELLERKHERD
ncbi:YopX family protein [Fructobacillus papyrifericola]|uniref:YopX protein domain-containing protein n=1 Tax=Fructobacillus papyrifericola TaxID=2713172 RepID=A0ABS5QU15_9LACO|nr:YopX family protein [Fructobacillus papyrifericola]MBS9336427.1 hypothetical protein [Fructobacillus papyrifericola]